MIFFPIMFSFMEIILHFSVFKNLDTNIFYVVLFSAVYGLLAFGLTSFSNRTVNKVIIGIITAVTTAYFGLQTVYYNIFKVYISFYSISQNAGDATEFWKEALHGIAASIPQLIFLIIIPVVAVIVMTKLGFIGVGLDSKDSPDAQVKKSEKNSGRDSDKASVETDTAGSSDSSAETNTADSTNSSAKTNTAGSANSSAETNTAGSANTSAETNTAGSASSSVEADIPAFVVKTPPKSVLSAKQPEKRSYVSYIVRASVLLAAFLLYVAAVFLLKLSGTDANSPYDLYHNYFILDLGIQKLGVITSAGLDAKNTLFDSDTDKLNIAGMDGGNIPGKMPVAGLSPTPFSASQADSSLQNGTGQTDNSGPNGQISDPSQDGQSDTSNGNSGQNSDASAPAVSPTVAPSPSPTPIPIDTSPNVLDIDFTALAENESKKEIKSLHEYFANSEPTSKNQYTGMFKGYNFIYLTCEGYSPWAVDENVTPTLYKLTHSGFVFTNFYNPIWYTSTSDGEYVECIGLLPYNSNSFKRSKNNALPFCFGWQFLKLGYTSRAYHAHTVTYYGRNETHPNMGYIFKAKRGGLPITDVWPESDLEMMQLSLPEYINDEHFHAYYMTVSGHLEYSFNDNTQARKNKELVDDLPYSSEVKAYIACNAELDKALAYLIEELDKAGKLENTVIAFGADHYPYGLSDEAIDEIAGEHVDRDFELYRNNFVIWNSQMEEPVIVDKYGSGLDMMPTLSNLFGLEYDSRLFMGNDLLSDAPGLVIFGNQSFITDICKYNSKTHKVEMLVDVELPEDYIQTVSRIVQNKFTVSKNILLNDYYRYILDYIPNVVTKVPDSYE